MLTLNEVEAMCNKAMMSAQDRTVMGDYTVYIADGFSAKPHVTYQRFGVEKGEFPFGAFGTIWFIARGESVRWGGPAFFDAFHDPDLSVDMKRTARVNFARQQASQALDVITEDEKGATEGRA